MISFSGLSPEVAEAMCTPMHLILPSSPPVTSRPQSSIPGALYLGSITAVLDPSILKEHDIRHLVQVLDVPWLPAYEEDGYECYRLDILDTENQDLRPHLEDTVENIDSALRRGRNVLVHCQQGVSRSAAIRGMSFDSAVAFVRQRRPCIKPNSGFVRCLQEWERQWCPPSVRSPAARQRPYLDP
ncbi:phosphatases II [Lactarius deliciosus]|nr:phosphatases II [Lactarius deliciosus]